MTRSRLILLLALVSCALLAPAASAATPKYFGFNDNAAAFGLLSATKDAQLASQAGANSSRITFDWRSAEPTPGNWQLAKYDAIYKANLEKGIKTAFILMWAPSWAWADGTSCTDSTGDCRFPPGAAHMGAWRGVVRKLVERYPEMAALEIWNEPNYAGFWHGGIDPAAYTRLLIEAHDTVRAVGSPVPVLGGSITTHYVADTPDAMGHRKFLKGMYEAGVKGHMDGLAIHPYPQEIDLWVFYKMLSDVRDVRAMYDDDVPLWISEVGVTTVATGDTFWQNENDQAVMLKKLYNLLGGMDDVRSIWFHTLVDPSNVPSSSAERGYGTLRVDLTPKPAYCMFATLRQTKYRCPAKTPAVKADPVQELRWQAQTTVQAALDAARTYREQNGTYTGLSTAVLNSLNPALSATAPNGDLLPGPAADPARVGVWVWSDAEGEILLLCNSSKADRSYCIQNRYGSSPTYGSSDGSIYGTAGATTSGATWWW